MTDSTDQQPDRPVRWAVIVTFGRVVVEAATAEAAREKVERRGYIVREVNQDHSVQPLAF